MLALIPVAVLALLVAVLVAGARHPASQAQTTTASLGAAPSFDLTDLRDPAGTVHFGNPSRPTVVNFFAAWCIPCRDELPLLARTAQANQGVDFVGVDVQDVRTDALDLLAQSNAAFPVGMDPDKKLADRYRLRGMPTTFFVAPGGQVVAQHTGPLSARDLRLLLDRLEAR
ncbi:MAG TPA: TlpA disulfide reductase family protein [Acidimicrobiales bacterium]|nr:TlpA disulfide reductase family protein [Acidimicrobiales bacterium]